MITIAYDILFRVTIRHLYYRDELSTDFDFAPTPDCQVLLDRYGLIFKSFEQGFTVFARIVPGTDPPELYVPIDMSNLRFSFLMDLRNPYFYNFTAFHQKILPTPGNNILYFSNLNMASGAHPELGDAVSPGPGVYPQLQRRSVLNLTYPAPQSSSSPSLEDLFGNPYSPLPAIDLAGGDTTDQLQIDLAGVERIHPGRYLLGDPNLGGDLPLYYVPGLNGQDVFGIIDLYNDTLAVTSPPSDQVDGAYKFMNGNLLPRTAGALNADFTITFQPAAYQLRYVIWLKPATLAAGLITVGNLSISDNLGGLTFTAAVQSADQVTFTADADLPWSQIPNEFELRHSGIRLKILPNPTVFHPLKRQINNPGDPADDTLYYEVFVYV